MKCLRAGRCGERTERCRWQRKRSERVAAVKILSVRRKAAQKFWAPQQGHRPLRKRYKECDAERNPPVTASPCQPPLGKGAEGTGDADCHSQCAHWLRNDRGFYKGCGGRRSEGTPPYGGLQGARKNGRGRTPPLRRVTRGAVSGPMWASAPTGVTRSAVNGPSGTPAPTKAQQELR